MKYFDQYNKDLESALREWRVAHLPLSHLEQSPDDLGYAVRVANGLCSMSITQINQAKESIAYWRAVFNSNIGTLSLETSSEAQASLEKFKKIATALGETDLLFEICCSLISFPSTRAAAMIDMLQMNIDSHKMIKRDFLLEAIFNLDDPLGVSLDEFHLVAESLNARDFRFSTKKMELAIKNLVRKNYEISAKDRDDSIN